MLLISFQQNLNLAFHSTQTNFFSIFDLAIEQQLHYFEYEKYIQKIEK